MRVAYPAGKGRMILRTETDWDKDIEAISISDDGNISLFNPGADQPFLYFKPCLVTDDGIRHWSVGTNNLLLMEEDEKRISYSFFFGSDKGRFSEL